MRVRLLVCVIGLLALVTACQQAPPTLMVLVVTQTPIASSTAATLPVIQSASPLPPTRTPTPAPTPTRDPFPTPTLGQVQVAEQPFEHGRMFWIAPRQEIWVLVSGEQGRGVWTVYRDTFVEGEPESDPEIEPPDEGLYQPRRGFGKLWRENPEVREALGWAVTPDEFGYISRYEYHPGGRVANGTYQAAPGYHILFSLYEEAFRFNENDRTWQLGRGEP